MFPPVTPTSDHEEIPRCSEGHKKKLVLERGKRGQRSWRWICGRCKYMKEKERKQQKLYEQRKQQSGLS